MEQTSLFEIMWEAGYEECIKGGHCNYKPCTVAQGVNCCRDCPHRCGNPCRKGVRDDNKRMGI